jgi:uncharacterized protein YecT (DUF1311 family)
MLACLALSLLLGCDLSASEQDCRDAISTAEMRACVNERYRAADAELNRVYRQLAARLPPERQDILHAAQQSWIAFRDRHAAFAASAVAGGTLYPIVEVAELTRMTKQRTEQLRASLK